MEVQKKLKIESKKEILQYVIENDISYWKKIYILLSMQSDDSELLELIIEHKIEEIALANKEFGLSIGYNVNNNLKNSNSVIEKIIKESSDVKFSKACKEVLLILQHIPKKYYNIINPKFIDRLRKISDNNYNILITEKMKFKDLKILNETVDILNLISNKFWNKKEIEEIFNKI